MITILRGPRAVLARHGVASDLTTRWDVSAETPAWGALRAMTGQLRAALGDLAVESAFGGMGASAPMVALSLVIAPLEPQLTQAQRRARDAVSAASMLTLPRALPRSSPVARAWGEMISTCVAGRTPLVVVPELERVDLSTLRAARVIVAKTRGALSLLVGHDTQVTPPGPYESWIRKLKAREVAVMEALSGTYVERVDMRSEPMMARRPSTFEERETRSLESMRAAFASYAFDAALRLALELAPKLEGAELREAHAIAALSAQALDPHAKSTPHAPNGGGDDFGVGMVEAGLRGALDGETDPKKRARWGLELALFYARVRGEVEPALKFADQALRDAEASRAPYMEAWARIARARARRLAERREEAGGDLDAALVRLEDPAALRDTPRALVESTRALAANDRARLANAMGRRDELVHYRRVVDASLAALSPDERLGYEWLPPADDELSPDASRARHAAELAMARAALDPEDERAASRALAGAELCVGDAASAKEHLDAATRIAVLTKRPADEVFALHLERIVAALRAGAWDDAERDLSLVRADPRCEGDAAQAEALALLALVAAGKGEATALKERAAQAVAQAQRSGAPGALARVAKIAADAWLAAGAPADARAYVEKARGALTTDDRPEDVVGVMVTLLACGVGDDALVAEAAARAVDALGDVSAWWELPRLLPHVARVVAASPAAVDPGVLGALLAAAEQRADCAALVAGLRAHPA